MGNRGLIYSRQASRITFARLKEQRSTVPEEGFSTFDRDGIGGKFTLIARAVSASSTALHRMGIIQRLRDEVHQAFIGLYVGLHLLKFTVAGPGNFTPAFIIWLNTCLQKPIVRLLFFNYLLYFKMG